MKIVRTEKVGSDRLVVVFNDGRSIELAMMAGSFESEEAMRDALAEALVGE